MLSRWSSDTSNRSTEEIQQLITRTSSGTVSDSALALTRASPDKSRLKERIRYPLNPRVIVAPIQNHARTGGMDTMQDKAVVQAACVFLTACVPFIKCSDLHDTELSEENLAFTTFYIAYMAAAITFY